MSLRASAAAIPVASLLPCRPRFLLSYFSSVGWVWPCPPVLSSRTGSGATSLTLPEPTPPGGAPMPGARGLPAAFPIVLGTFSWFTACAEGSTAGQGILLFLGLFPHLREKRLEPPLERKGGRDARETLPTGDALLYAHTRPSLASRWQIIFGLHSEVLLHSPPASKVAVTSLVPTLP